MTILSVTSLKLLEPIRILDVLRFEVLILSSEIFEFLRDSFVMLLEIRAAVFDLVPFPLIGIAQYSLAQTMNVLVTPPNLLITLKGVRFELTNLVDRTVLHKS